MDTVKNVNGMWGVGKGGRETWGAAGKKHDYEGGTNQKLWTWLSLAHRKWRLRRSTWPLNHLKHQEEEQSEKNVSKNLPRTDFSHASTTLVCSSYLCERKLWLLSDYYSGRLRPNWCVSHRRASALGTRQSAAAQKSFLNSSFFLQELQKLYFAINFSFASSPKSIFRSRPLFGKLSKEMTFFALYHTQYQRHFWGGGLKNTPLPTKVLRPKKATKECFIMQNVSGGEEENGHGWLKKNEVLRGGSAIQKLLERLYPSGNWWMNVPMDYYC